jgi:hypothetical protein
MMARHLAVQKNTYGWDVQGAYAIKIIDSILQNRNRTAVCADHLPALDQRYKNISVQAKNQLYFSIG